jgi:DNA-binding XRE family transcriptional regulator
MSVYVDSIELVTHTCGKCGVVFAMSREFQDARKKDRQTWYCPNGDPRVFTGKTEAEKLREELERQRQITDAEQARASRLQQERDQATRAHGRMRQRVFNGVCPCCNRTFQNLLQHMKTEHEGEVSIATLRQAFGMTQTQVAKEVGVTPFYVSLYERGRPVPGYAKKALDSWTESQAGRSPLARL